MCHECGGWVCILAPRIYIYIYETPYRRIKHDQLVNADTSNYFIIHRTVPEIYIFGWGNGPCLLIGMDTIEVALYFNRFNIKVTLLEMLNISITIPIWIEGSKGLFWMRLPVMI